VRTTSSVDWRRFFFPACEREEQRNDDFHDQTSAKALSVACDSVR
jgi:hypothetical protein